MHACLHAQGQTRGYSFQGSDDLAGVACILDGLHQSIEALVVAVDVRREAALVAHGGRVLGRPATCEVVALIAL